MILAIDTSGSLAVVAAATNDGQIRFGGTGGRPRSHAEEIGVLVARALACGEVERVVVGRGPGSFTGLRVGLAFAQVWAWARGVPVTGVCSLDVVAAQADLADGWVVMDARRRELFAARYGDGRRIGPPLVRPRRDVAGLVSGSRVVGDIALLTSDDRREFGLTTLNPAALGAVAARAVIDDPGGSIQPEYLRRPDVTVSAAVAASALDKGVGA